MGHEGSLGPKLRSYSKDLKILETLMIWVLLRSKWSFDHEIKHTFFDKMISLNDVGRISKQSKTKDLLFFGLSEIPSF